MGAVSSKNKKVLSPQRTNNATPRLTASITSLDIIAHHLDHPNPLVERNAVRSQQTASALVFAFFFAWFLCTPSLHAEEKKQPPTATHTPTNPTATNNDTSALALTARYLVHLHDKIQRSWDIQKLPLMDIHKRSTTLTLWIDAQGKLQKIKIAQSSGLDAFDHSLLKAVYKASPFDKPHPSFLEDAQKNGLDIVFRRRAFNRKLVPLKLKHAGENIVPNWTPGKPKK